MSKCIIETDQIEKLLPGFCSIPRYGIVLYMYIKGNVRFWCGGLYEHNGGIRFNVIVIGLQMMSTNSNHIWLSHW